MGKIKNLKMDQDFVNVMLNGEDFENQVFYTSHYTI